MTECILEYNLVDCDVSTYLQKYCCTEPNRIWIPDTASGQATVLMLSPVYQNLVWGDFKLLW